MAPENFGLFGVREGRAQALQGFEACLEDRVKRAISTRSNTK